MKNFLTPVFCFFILVFCFFFSTLALANDCDDSDGDGVCNEDDNCDSTPAGVTVLSLEKDALWAGCSAEQKAKTKAQVRRNERGDEKLFVHFISLDFLAAPSLSGETSFSTIEDQKREGSAYFLNLGYRFRPWPDGWKGFFIGGSLGVEFFKSEPKGSEGGSRIEVVVDPDDIKDPDVVLVQQTLQASGSSLNFSKIEKTRPSLGLEAGWLYGNRLIGGPVFKFQTSIDDLIFTHLNLIPGVEVGYIFKPGIKISIFGGYSFLQESNIHQDGFALAAGVGWGFKPK